MTDYSMGRKTVQQSIPPEGDAYNKQRQEELYGLITTRATLSRRFAELVQQGAPAEEIHAITEAIAQIDRDIPRLSQDLNVSTQGRNLNVFLERLDESIALKDARDEERHKQQMDGLAGVGARLGKIEETQMEQAERLDRVEASVSGLSEQQGTTEAKVDILDSRVGSLETRMGRVEDTLTLISGEITEIRVGMTRRQLEREEHPPDPEIQRLMDDAEQ